jgi:hypothetical protein
MIPASAILLSDGASEVLVALRGASRAEGNAIFRRVQALKPVLLVDCLHGEVVRRASIPAKLQATHGLENLYVEDLPDFWGLLYTIVRRNGRRLIIILEIVDHKQYSRWFPGRRS